MQPQSTTLKVCTKCGVEKPLELFARRSLARDGRNSWCKACLKAHAANPEIRERRLEYLRRWNADPANKDRKKQHVLSPEAAARRLERSRSDEARERAADWYRENHERALAYSAERRASPEYQDHQRSYRVEYRERPDKRVLLRAQARRHAQKRYSLKRGLPATFTEQEWQRCLEYFEYRCVYCGQTADCLEQDHFVPLKRGGPYTATNIVCACRLCNARKRHVAPEVWCDSETYARILAYFRSLS